MNETLYLVIPCYNETEVLQETARRLDAKIAAMVAQGLIDRDSKVVFVDDGSKDDTWNIIKQLHHANKLFAGVRLSRNFGQHNALFAGLMFAKDKADITISMDADLQDDVNAMDAMVSEYYKGNDIVYGVRSSRKKDSFVRRNASESFYKFTKHMGIEMVPDHAHYRLMSQRAVRVLSEYGEVNLFLPYLVPQLGFNFSIVYYERNERFAGKTKYSLRNLFLMGVDGITSFSTKPIECISVFAGISLCIFLASIIGILVQLKNGGSVSAWLPVFSSVWAIAMFIMVSIRIIGEYIGKVYKETKRRPRYSVTENLMQEGDR